MVSNDPSYPAPKSPPGGHPEKHFTGQNSTLSPSWSLLKSKTLIEPESVWIENRMWALIDTLSKCSPGKENVEKYVLDSWLRELHNKIGIVLDRDE